MKIAIIDFTNDFEEAIEMRNILLHHVDVKVNEIQVYRPNDLFTISVDAIILSGSALKIDENPSWHEEVSKFLKEKISLEIPIFGICYGAQLLAKIYSKQNEKLTGLSENVEIGSIKVDAKKNSWLFNGIKSNHFYSYHYDEIFNAFEINGEQITINASSKRCAIQGFECKNQIICGTQFHPEKSALQAKNLRLKNKKSPYLYNEGEINDNLRYMIFNNFLKRVLK